MGQLVTNPNKEVAPEGCPNFCVAGGGAHTTSTPAGAQGGAGKATTTSSQHRTLLTTPRSAESFSNAS